jgi:hypothetical protein
MIKLDQILPEISSSKDYDEKNQITALVLTYIKSKRYKPSKHEKATLTDFVFHEMREIISAAKKAEGYKEKSLIFRYGDTLFYLITEIHKSPAELSAENIATTKELASVMKEELYLENKFEEMFEQNIVSSMDLRDLLARLSETKDEYEKGLFYAGLLHYRNEHSRLLETSKLAISEYMKKEMERYIAEYDAENEDKTKAFEALCDACACFISDDILSLLYRVLEFENNGLSMFASMTLLKHGRDIPEKNVTALANDLVYAEGFFSILRDAGKEALFPAELRNEVYLAKSDLVHWLTFPTELGKAPDEIEYVGKAEFKNDADIFIFKFRSNSNTLSDDIKGRWLIGWANSEGDTFSNFDEYEKFEKETPEKTVEYIKKKLL